MSYTLHRMSLSQSQSLTVAAVLEDCSDQLDIVGHTLTVQMSRERGAAAAQVSFTVLITCLQSRENICKTAVCCFPYIIFVCICFLCNIKGPQPILHFMISFSCVCLGESQTNQAEKGLVSRTDKIKLCRINIFSD